METAHRIFIFHNKPGPRHNYIAGFLGDSLGIEFSFTTETPGKGPLILYGMSTGSDGIRIPDSGFLSETGIRRFVPDAEIKENILLFHVAGNYDLPFDIFSAIFYLITRYEEYLPFEADSHGRFELAQSLACKKGFHQEPVVDRWLMMLRDLIGQRFPEVNFPSKKFTFISSLDIDSPWAFKNRRLGRNLPGLAKNLVQGKFSDFFYRLKVIRNRAVDPFDVYTFIDQTENQFQFRSIFFFLLADDMKYDPNHSLHSEAFKILIRELSDGHQAGIHPSYNSNNDNGKLNQEISLFRSLTGRAPELSRQHYLMLKLPDTYRRLIQHGISDDYSMGYASGVAFRAGTTLPFRFYDLKSEEETSLTVHPFTVMDVTLRQYMKLDPGQAAGVITDMIEKIRQVNGNFVSLWHNESLSEFGLWKGWRSVFTEMVRRAFDQ